MGILDYLSKNRKSTQSWKRDNIELWRPIVNIFLGVFEQNERKFLVQTMNERVGSSGKIHYCQIIFGKEKQIVEEQIYYLPIGDIEKFGRFDITVWDKTKQQAGESRALKVETSNFVKYVFNEVSTVAYDSKGRIRLNFILQADFVGCAVLEDIIDTFKNCFSDYFTNGVHIDAYCLLDQKGYRSEESGEERKVLNFKSLTLLNEITNHNKISLAYILSNYTNKDCLEVDSLKDRIQTIALNIIIKDGKTAGSKERVYKDELFIQEARHYSGNFCSLGKINLGVDTQVRDQVVYKAVFDDLYYFMVGSETVDEIIQLMDISKDKLESQINKLVRSNGITEQTFYPMIISSQINPSAFLSEKRSILIEGIYGKNLEYFWQLNCGIDKKEREQLIEEIIKKVNVILSEVYCQHKCSLAGIYSVIKRVEDIFQKYVMEYEVYFDNVKIAVDMWKNSSSEISNLRERIKETETVKAVYTLACQFIEKKVALANCESYLYVAEECLKRIRKNVEYYKKQSDTIISASQELGKVIMEIEHTGETLLKGNIQEYYTKITNEFMQYSTEYAQFRRNVNNQICKYELLGDSIFETVIQFCDDVILKNETYSNDIAVEMLKRLKNYKNLLSDESIYDLAFETIMKNSKRFANHTEFGSVYEAICFLVNPSNEFVKCTNNRMKSLLLNHQLKLFFENHYDGMDILFMDGCFELNSLYQYKLYEKAYQNLQD